MLRLLAQPVFCFFDPSWWSRHIDFHFPTIKLQPGFCLSCVLQCFSCFETNFFIDVLSNFGTAFWSRTTLVVESAHRLSHLLSTLQICKQVVQDIPKKLLWICGTVFTFWRGQCPNCRTVVSLGGFILASAPEFLSPWAFVQSMLHLVFYSCASTLDFIFF